MEQPDDRHILVLEPVYKQGILFQKVKELMIVSYWRAANKLIIYLWGFYFLISFPILTYSDLGNEKTRPQRIVSLAPFVTEELYLLNVQGRLIACTTYCNRPGAAKNKPRVSTAVKPNIEKIVSLKPDLILAAELVDSRSIKKLELLGIPVKVFPVARSFSHLCDIFLEIGSLVGRPDLAVNIVNRSKKRIKTVTHRVKNLSRLKVFMQIGSRPLFTVIENTFMNDYIEYAGGVNIAAGAQSGIYSREEVLRQNPDVIVIVSMGEIQKQEIKAWQRYGSIAAVKNKRILIIDSEKACSATPETFCDVLEEIAQFLYPQIK
jgi:iron complex transport system substrate-binding protein